MSLPRGFTPETWQYQVAEQIVREGERPPQHSKTTYDDMPQSLPSPSRRTSQLPTTGFSSLPSRKPLPIYQAYLIPQEQVGGEAQDPLQNLRHHFVLPQRPPSATLPAEPLPFHTKQRIADNAHSASTLSSIRITQDTHDPLTQGTMDVPTVPTTNLHLGGYRHVPDSATHLYPSEPFPSTTLRPSIQKGSLLFVFGFLMPPLWWTGAILPRKPSTIREARWRQLNRMMSVMSVVIVFGIIGIGIWQAKTR
ncbi:hypothetical protein BZG36_05169 [Bifiguratus adelaidae]|uniref:Uncharacterized protein n=1 Tax=Bifiguratus adelaidae TaxID=1938954 RepID=A0A261XTX7_9FUNG|nr:hypothetical protein BZG36_05169 [Bifiguratus adelaidae]